MRQVGTLKSIDPGFFEETAVSGKYHTECYTRIMPEDLARIFKTKVFARLCGKVEVVDAELVACVAAIESGRKDADLGRGLLKQRLARSGGGKSGGYRTILIFRHGRRAIFLDVFAKSSQPNITDKELSAYRKLAGTYLRFTNEQITRIVKSGELIEIERGAQTNGKEK